MCLKSAVHMDHGNYLKRDCMILARMLYLDIPTGKPPNL